MRSIVVPVADRPECAKALATTFALAERLQSNVRGFHIRPHRLERKTKNRPKLNVMRGLTGLGDFLDELTEAQVDMNAKGAQRMFEELCAAHDFELRNKLRMGDSGGQATWKEVVGSLQAQFSIIGPLADMLVVSRPKNDQSARAKAFLLGALMHSGRPVLVLPQRKIESVGQRIMVAWNQSIEAAAIVHAAMPMLKVADQVHIMSAGPQNRVGPKAAAVVDYLRGWGVKARAGQTRGMHETTELMDAYDERECDLMLMGAYSRARWRETVFGGLTEHILFKARIPALMMHR